MYPCIKSCMQTNATWKLESPFELMSKAFHFKSSLKKKNLIFIGHLIRAISVLSTLFVLSPIIFITTL